MNVLVSCFDCDMKEEGETYIDTREFQYAGTVYLNSLCDNCMEEAESTETGPRFTEIQIVCDSMTCDTSEVHNLFSEFSHFVPRDYLVEMRCDNHD